MAVPKEIQALGAEAVANHLIEEEKHGKKRLNEARIIILGEKGAGKTCLARRLVNPNAKMTEDNESTLGVDKTDWISKSEEDRVDTTFWTPKTKEGEDSVKIHIWDFAGHVITHAAHRFFMSERCVYIIVYNGRSEEKDRLVYWLEHVKNYGGDSRVFILINKRDNHRQDIPVNNLKEKYGNIVESVELSIQDDAAALKAFGLRVVSELSKNASWNDTIPKNYFSVKEELEGLFRQTKNGAELIQYSQLAEIARKYKVEDIENLVNSLHALGICLRYKAIKGIDKLVLNPEWISHGVYKVINWVHEKKKHEVKLEEFKEIFNDENERYGEENHRFIFKLMICYELAYKIKKQKTLIIPHLMPEDRPKEIPGFPNEIQPICRYVVEHSLPADTISRFIVRHNKEINEPVVWRHGVLLKNDKGQTALVRADKQEIKVYVKYGNEIDYLNSIRETLKDIFEKYKSKTNLEYNIRYRESKEIEPLYLDDSTIYGYAINGKEYFDPKCNRSINIESVVEEMNINNGNLMGSNGGMHIGETQTYKNPVQGMTVNNVLPEKLEPKAYKDFISAMERFLKSKEDVKDLTKEFYDTLKTFMKEAKKEERSKRGFFNLKKGRAKNEEPSNWWKGFREFLSDGANAATVATFAGAVGKFLVSHANEISETARGLFENIMQMVK